VTFVSATGDDPEADQVVGFLNQINCDAAITRERDRRTSVKRRYISHGQQLLRADCETTRPISQDTLTKLLESFRAALPSCHIVVVSDYAKGVLSGDNVQSFIGLAKAAGKPLIVDPKGRDYPRYRNASVIKPNLRELAEATGMPVDTADATTAAARNLLQQTDTEAIVVTRGAAGMMLILAGGEVKMFTSQTREVFDVSGAGDTVAAMLAAALGAGIAIEQAVYLANVAAGVVVTKAGTAVVEYEDIRREFELMEFASSDKRLPNTESAAGRTRSWRDSGLKVGLLVGAFDSIGRFEVALLQEARGRCDRLVVGIIGDMDEPDAINSCFTEDEGARAFVVASLTCVDLVVVQKESSPDALIQLLQPDVVFESNEYPVTR
jgi:D-beta-D-heptose 7-phosphate kinase/D-beta-D-heptose 1-phosphate adenosyltransferase